MKSAIVLLPLLSLIVSPVGAAAQTPQRQQLLSTEEWVDLNNKDEGISIAYLKGVSDTLGAIGNFTCSRPVVLGQSAARIKIEFVDRPERVQTWVIFAFMVV